jgi:hypothetical protein
MAASTTPTATSLNAKFLQQCSNVPLDLVADRPDLADWLACWVIELPVEVAFARVKRALVTAAHGDDDVGSAQLVVGPPPRLLVADIDAFLGHRRHGNRVDPIGRFGSAREDVNLATGEMAHEPCGHLRTAGVVHAQEYNAGLVIAHGYARTIRCAENNARRPCRHRSEVSLEVPVQYFQSVIAIELGVIGALLFQIRYFEVRGSAERESELPSPWLRLLVAVILGATLFGSLDAIQHGGSASAAIAVTVGLAVSSLPILLRVLPPLATSADSGKGRTYSTATVAGLLLYGVAVGALVILTAR